MNMHIRALQLSVNALAALLLLSGCATSPTPVDRELEYLVEQKILESTSDPVRSHFQHLILLPGGSDAVSAVRQFLDDEDRTHRFFADCSADQAMLEEQAAILKHSFALNYLVFYCARQQGEEAKAERTFAGLQQHIERWLATGRQDALPVLMVEDASYLIELAGWNPLSHRITTNKSGSSLWYEILAENPSTLRQYRLQFDIGGHVLTAYRLMERYQWQSYRTEQPIAVRALNSPILKEGELTFSIRADWLANGAWTERSLEQAETFYVKAVPHSMDARFGYARLLLQQGRLQPGPRQSNGDDSSEQVVDLILPAAEQGIGEAFLWLAFLYESGIGVTAHQENAQVFFKAAQQRMGQQAAKLALQQLKNLLMQSKRLAGA